MHVCIARAADRQRLGCRADGCLNCVWSLWTTCDGCEREAQTLEIRWQGGWYRLCDPCLDAFIWGLAVQYYRYGG